MSTFTIRYTRTANHIEGIANRTKDSADGLNYALSACPSLSRNVTKMAKGFSSEDLAEVLANAPRSRKLCQTCKAAAEAQLVEQA
jgi:hypothetical protein